MDGAKKEDEEVPLLKVSKEQAKIVRRSETKVSKGGKKGKSCILTVGSTGTGKTSTINIFTGAKEEVGDDVFSKTSLTKTVEDVRHKGGTPWVDNPGWGDTGGRSDNLTFKDLLRHLVNENIESVVAVVWCVTPNQKMDMMLQTQAKLIDMLTQKEDKGTIWNNVILLSKGTLKKTAKEDCIGAEMAAKEVCETACPRSLGYKIADVEDLEDLSPDARKKRRILTEAEALRELEQELSKLPDPVQVVFQNKKCRDCGQVGDPRLMEDFCHRRMVLGHPGALRLKKKYSKPLIGAAYAAGAVGVIGLGTASALVPGSELLLVGVPVLMGPGSGMALRRAFSDGDWRYKCCEKTTEKKTAAEEDGLTTGCTKMCDNCKAEWGTGNPCVLIRHPDRGLAQSMDNYQYENKDHDLQDI